MEQNNPMKNMQKSIIYNYSGDGILLDSTFGYRNYPNRVTFYKGRHSFNHKYDLAKLLSIVTGNSIAQLNFNLLWEIEKKLSIPLEEDLVYQFEFSLEDRTAL